MGKDERYEQRIERLCKALANLLAEHKLLWLEAGKLSGEFVTEPYTPAYTMAVHVLRNARSYKSQATD